MVLRCAFAALLTVVVVTVPASAVISYGTPTFPATGTGPTAIVVADFDNDCHPDFATANLDGTVTVRFGDGTGGFPTAHTITGLADSESIVAGDFNGDGAIDLAVGNVGSFTPLAHTIQIYLNDGAGNFTLQAGTLSASSRAHALVAADFNEDGKLDLVAPDASGGGTGVMIFFGNGDGTFSAGTHLDVEPSPGANLVSGLVAADLNGDGHLDLASANGGTLSWLFGDGHGGFGTPNVFTYASPDGAVDVTAGDINNDGHIDLATAGGNVVAGASVFINSGTGTFTRSQFSMPQAPANPISVTLADLDGDGNLDIVTADQFGCTPWGSNLAARPGNGDGTFGAAVPISVGYGPTCINSHWQPNALAAVDLNCDGKMDLISANMNVTFVSVMLTPGGSDTIAPVVTGPPPVTVGSGTSCSAVVTDAQLGTATATDNCGCVLIVRSGVPAGNVFPGGTTVVTYTATDAHGNSGTAHQNVTVTDSTPPSITAPANITVTSGSSCTATPSLGSPVVSDNCSGVTTSAARSDGRPLAAPFDVGTTTITWTARDAQNNTSTATQTVTVNPPVVVIATASASPNVLWPPNHKMVDITVSYTTSGGCGGINCSITSITSNEPLNGTGDGNTSTDWQIVDAHHVRLRAERSGGGSGRVYTITITCTDGHGQTATRTVTVNVPHN